MSALPDTDPDLDAEPIPEIAPAARRTRQARVAWGSNVGTVGRGEKGAGQLAQMVEVACKYDKPVRIGVNWGSLDQELLKKLMDRNATRAQPWDVKQVMYEALVRSAIESAEAAREIG